MDRRLIPHQTEWHSMRAAFRWRLPARFNIARAACDDWAACEPGKLAITHLQGDGSAQDWTYGQIKGASDALSLALADQGVGVGDRVAICLPQHPAVIITHFAAMKLGAVSVPLFTLFGSQALAYRLNDSGAKVVVTDAAQLDRIMALRGDLPNLTSIYSINPALQPVLNLWDEIGRARGNAPIADTGADDPAVMIYTSGTTGPAKGVLHAHRFLIGHLPSIETTHEGFPQPGDRGWTPADWAWIGGLMDMAMPCLYYGVPQISHRMAKFNPGAAFRLIDDWRVRNLFLPPTALKLMRSAGGRVKAPVRSVSSGGESLGADLTQWAHAALGGPINEIYGQTECNLIMAHTGTTMARKPGTMGQPVPGFEVALMGVDGRPVSTSEMGEIAVKAPNPVMFLRYWNKPKSTAAKFQGGWLMTGDLAVAGDDGYFTYHGRDDDVINSAGYRIGPSEIENCLTGDDDVVMAAVIGVPDPVRGQAVKAFVTLRDGAGWDGVEARLIDRVRTLAGAHLAPRGVERIAEMPMTATGKIMRRALREEKRAPPP